MPDVTRRPPPQPLPVDTVRVVAVGTAIFTLGVVAALVALPWLRSHDRVWWLWTVVAGALLGLLGLAVTIRQRRRAGHRTDTGS